MSISPDYGAQIVHFGSRASANWDCVTYDLMERVGKECVRVFGDECQCGTRLSAGPDCQYCSKEGKLGFAQRCGKEADEA